MPDWGSIPGNRDAAVLHYQSSDRDPKNDRCYCGEGLRLDPTTLLCQSASMQLAFDGELETRPAKTGGNSPLVLTARVTSEGAPRPGITVAFTAEVTPRSGGHDHHDALRPRGSVSPTSGTTDGNGEIKVRFQAPEVSGLHKVTATCADCGNSPVNREVRVKVPNLVDLFTLPFREPGWAWPGIGQTNRHPDNHYLTTEAAFLLHTIAGKYRRIWPSAPRMTLNDGSVVWGGKFDIFGEWGQNSKSHAEHRVGTNIDIRANGADGAVPSNIREAVFRWLGNITLPEDDIPLDLLVESVQPLREGRGTQNEHFHLRLGATK